MNTQLANRLSNRITQLEKALERANTRLAHIESRLDNLPPSQPGLPQGEEEEPTNRYGGEQDHAEGQEDQQAGELVRSAPEEMPIGASGIAPAGQAGRRRGGDRGPAKT